MTTIPESELDFRFFRAGGPGGQNVNKVATAVQMRFDVRNSPSLTEAVKARLMKLAGSRLTLDGVIVITAVRFRTQERNRADAIERLQAMVDKLSKLPIEALAENLNGSLGELRQTLKQVNGEVLPQLQRTLEQSEQTLQNASQTLAEDSPQRQQLGDTLDEVQRAVRSVRTLSDYLGRHPESLIRGRSGDETPGTYKGQAKSRALNPEPQP